MTTTLWNYILCGLHSSLKHYRLYMGVLHIEWLFYYRRCLFTVLELDVKCEWRVIAPNMHHSLFPISHFCILTHITWKLEVIYGRYAYRMTVLLSKTFLQCFRVAWEIRLESYGSRHASVVLWFNIVCVYCKPVHTSIFDAQLRMTTK